MEFILLFLLLILIILSVIILIKQSKISNKKNDSGIDNLKIELIKEISESNAKNQINLQKFNEDIQKTLYENSKELIKENNEERNKTFNLINDSLIKIQESTEKRLTENNAATNKVISEGLVNLQKTNVEKLNDIQTKVDERLTESLDKKLDTSFKQIGEQLNSLYKSLGELKMLESGVSNLNKTLSNIKTRGIYGEMQLENILANILDKKQYETNVITKSKSSDRVEFAVKIPDKENANNYILLPIDSKFPADIYNKILTASEAGDTVLLKASTKELKDRIKQEASTIKDKNIDPPNTTDFAIMFLPTESLYSEVLRIDGLVEECQNKYKVVISGPTTLTALLNSLSIGFKYLTVNKKSEEILKVLDSFKTQFEKFDALIEKTQKKLIEAQNVTEDLQKRGGLIQKSLQKIEKFETKEENLISETIIENVQ